MVQSYASKRHFAQLFDSHNAANLELLKLRPIANFPPSDSRASYGYSPLQFLQRVTVVDDEREMGRVAEPVCYR
jgi:hypothetical protein